MPLLILPPEVMLRMVSVPVLLLLRIGPAPGVHLSKCRGDACEARHYQDGDGGCARQILACIFMP